MKRTTTPLSILLLKRYRVVALSTVTPFSILLLWFSLTSWFTTVRIVGTAAAVLLLGFGWWLGGLADSMWEDD